MKQLFPYLRFLKDVRTHFIIAIVAAVINGIASGFGIPFFINVVCKKLLGTEGLPIATIILYCLMPGGVVAIRGISDFAYRYFIGYCGQHILQEIRILLFGKLQRLPLGFYHKRAAGDILSRSLNDTTILQMSLNELATEIIKQPVTLLGAIGYLGYQCYQESDVAFLLVFILAIPICVGPIVVVGKQLKKKAANLQKEISGVTECISQNIQATREVRAFNLEEKENKRFRAASQTYFKAMIKFIKYANILSPTIEFVSALGVGAAFYYSYQKGISFNVFFSLVTALYFCYDPIKRLGRLNARIQEGTAALTRIEEILDEPETIQSPQNPKPLENIRGTLNFEQVDFSYGEAAILENVSITLEAGKTYGLVGPSGAGKSTFANLIPRFYDISSGTITLDGMDTRDCTLKDLRSQISLVSQEPILFNESIRENLLLGNPDASNAEIETACRKAYIHEVIEAFEDGYDTVVGPMGNRLSGGQRQRVAIARAFLKDAPILIFDEATSALDNESENIIQQALEKLMENKTVIIIAHRFSSIKHADKILAFENGNICEQGTHKELMQKNGLYARLYNSQG